MCYLRYDPLQIGQESGHDVTRQYTHARRVWKGNAMQYPVLRVTHRCLVANMRTEDPPPPVLNPVHVVPSKQTGSSTTGLSIQRPTEGICVFRMVAIINSDRFPVQN
jgi:hypothetical protein